VVVSPLNALASIAEARGDLDAASAAYEALLERCRATGQPLQVPFSLVALAALRARQGDDVAADRLYQERSVQRQPVAVGRRHGRPGSGRPTARDRRGHGHCSTRLEATTAASISRPARPVCSRAWRGGRSPPATPPPPPSSPLTPPKAPRPAGPAAQLLADTAMAAVTAITHPTRHNAEVFVALTQQRAQERAYRSLTDEPDVAALAAHLALSAH